MLSTSGLTLSLEAEWWVGYGYDVIYVNARPTNHLDYECELIDILAYVMLTSERIHWY